MKQPKAVMDRRIIRTRGVLQHALTSLILKKGYEAITIQDICDEANVGRSTFYAHYTSKDDLKRSGFERLRKGRVRVGIGQPQHRRVEVIEAFFHDHGG